MDEFDDIEKMYHDMVNKFSKKPDDINWSRLENNLDLDDIGVENWYKDQVENSAKMPNEAIWENIATKIDTDSVWKRLAASLQRRDKIIWWWQFSASSFTLLAAIGLMLFSQYPKEESTTLVSKTLLKSQLKEQSSEKQISKNLFENTTVKEKNSNPSDIEKETPKANFNPSTKVVTKKTNTASNRPLNAALSSNNSTTFSEETTNGNIENITNEITTPNVDNQQTKFPIISAVPFLTEVQLKKSLPTKITIPFDTLLLTNTLPKDYFYVEAQLINPWLMNSNTYSALRRNSTDYNQTLFTGGFSLGYVHWLDRFGIEGNISYQEKGHNYMLYVEGKSYEKKINLDYVLASVQIKKSINENRLKPWKSFVSGGLYYGRAIHQNTVFNGAPYTSDIEYAKNDFGISLNFETQLKYKKNNIALGLGVAQGLKNIYKGADYFEFSKTYNFTLTGSIKYIISIKK